MVASYYPIKRNIYQSHSIAYHQMPCIRKNQINQVQPKNIHALQVRRQFASKDILDGDVIPLSSIQCAIGSDIQYDLYKNEISFLRKGVYVIYFAFHVLPIERNKVLIELQGTKTPTHVYATAGVESELKAVLLSQTTVLNVNDIYEKYHFVNQSSGPIRFVEVVGTTINDSFTGIVTIYRME